MNDLAFKERQLLFQVQQVDDINEGHKRGFKIEWRKYKNILKKIIASFGMPYEANEYTVNPVGSLRYVKPIHPYEKKKLDFITILVDFDTLVSNKKLVNERIMINECCKISKKKMHTKNDKFIFSVFTKEQNIND